MLNRDGCWRCDSVWQLCEPCLTAHLGVPQQFLWNLVPWQNICGVHSYRRPLCTFCQWIQMHVPWRTASSEECAHEPYNSTYKNVTLCLLQKGCVHHKRCLNHLWTKCVQMLMKQSTFRTSIFTHLLPLMFIVTVWSQPRDNTYMENASEWGNVNSLIVEACTLLNVTSRFP